MKNNNNIFKSIARQNGVSEEEVKREIERSIAEACKDPDDSQLVTDVVLNKIGKGKVPTPEEVMEHVMREVAKSKMS